MNKLNKGRDWPKLVNDLIDSGLSRREIASRCMASVSNICRMANGFPFDPEWTVGHAIIRLHKSRCGSK